MQVTFDPLKDVNNRVKVRFYFTGLLQNGVTCIWPDKMLLWDINSVNSVAVDLPTALCGCFTILDRKSYKDGKPK